MHRDEGADEGNEDRGAGRNAFGPHGDRVPHLVDEHQQHEPEREQPTPFDRIGADREQHGGQSLELQDACENTEELGLAEDEEKASDGDARRGLASMRLARPGLSLRTLETLVDRTQVLDFPRSALGLAPVGHGCDSLTGRGMIQASYATMPRKTSFMMPKLSAAPLKNMAGLAGGNVTRHDSPRGTSASLMNVKLTR